MYHYMTITIILHDHILVTNSVKSTLVEVPLSQHGNFHYQQSNTTVHFFLTRTRFIYLFIKFVTVLLTAAVF